MTCDNADANCGDDRQNRTRCGRGNSDMDGIRCDHGGRRDRGDRGDQDDQGGCRDHDAETRGEYECQDRRR